MKTKVFFSTIALLFVMSFSSFVQSKDDNLYIKRSSLKKTSFPYWAKLVNKDGSNIDLGLGAGRSDAAYILIKTSGGKVVELYKLIAKSDEYLQIISFVPNRWYAMMMAYTKPYANIMFRNFMEVDPSNNKPLSKAATKRHFDSNHNGGAVYFDSDAAAMLSGEAPDLFGDLSASNVKIIN